MDIFAQTGLENTERTLALALQRATEEGYDIVASSTRGLTAKMLVEMAGKMGFTNRLIIVRTVSSAEANGQNRFAPELKASLEQSGAVFVTAAHALSAGERGISSKSKGMYPLEIMAHTLRTLGQGTKVCFECAVMAMDADVIPYGKPVVAVGGTANGVDTALIITPSYSASILDTKIHEILCKPGLYCGK